MCENSVWRGTRQRLKSHELYAAHLLEKLVYALSAVAYPAVFLAFPLQIYHFLIVSLPLLYF